MKLIKSANLKLMNNYVFITTTTSLSISKINIYADLITLELFTMSCK